MGGVRRRNDERLGCSGDDRECAGCGGRHGGIAAEPLRHGEPVANLRDIEQRPFQIPHAYFVPQSLSACQPGTSGGMERASERAFTLVELLVGIAIAAIVFSLLASVANRVVATASSTESRVQAGAAAQVLLARLDAESASAWAVYVPPSDIDGIANADGHELDFYTEDGAHRSYSWAYLFNAKQQTVTRYAYGAGSTVATDTFAPIASFAVRSVPASQLGANDPLFSGAAAQDVRYPIPSLPSAIAGNAAVFLHVVSTGVELNDALTSATAPTTFTVVINYTPSPAPLPTPTPTPIPVTVPPP